MKEIDFIDLEEQMIDEQERKEKKHYLNPQSKAFINKFLKVLKFK